MAIAGFPWSLRDLRATEEKPIWRDKLNRLKARRELGFEQLSTNLEDYNFNEAKQRELGAVDLVTLGGYSCGTESASRTEAMKDPLVAIFQDKITAYRRTKAEATARALLAGPVATRGPPVLRRANLEDDLGSCPEPAPLPTKIFQQEEGAISDALDPNPQRPSDHGPTPMSQGTDGESPGTFQPRSPLKIRQQNPKPSTSSRGRVPFSRGTEDQDQLVRKLQKELEDLKIKVRSKSDELYSCQVANASLRQRLSASDEVLQDLWLKYSSLLKQILLAKELMSHVNIFLVKKKSGVSQTIKETVSSIHRGSTTAADFELDASIVKKVQRYPAYEETLKKYQSKVLEGFTQEIEHLTHSLKSVLR